MIDVAEIRAWNWLQNTNGNVGKVIGIDVDSMGFLVIMQYHPNSTSFSHPGMLKPITLTGEILEKNGFELKEGIYVLKSNPRLGWYPKEKQLIVHYCTFPVKIEFVHQMQNIMLDLGIKENFVI